MFKFAEHKSEISVVLEKNEYLFSLRDTPESFQAEQALPPKATSYVVSALDPLAGPDLPISEPGDSNFELDSSDTEFAQEYEDEVSDTEDEEGYFVPRATASGSRAAAQEVSAGPVHQTIQQYAASSATAAPVVPQAALSQSRDWDMDYEADTSDSESEASDVEMVDNSHSEFEASETNAMPKAIAEVLTAWKHASAQRIANSDRSAIVTRSRAGKKAYSVEKAAAGEKMAQKAGVKKVAAVEGAARMTTRRL